MASTPAEFFTEKAAQIAGGAGKLEGINATYQFNLGGEGGGNWLIELSPEKKDVRAGEDPDAQCVITMTAADFMAMIKGALNPQMAFMTGKLKVKGDISLALKLQAILS